MAFVLLPNHHRSQILIGFLSRTKVVSNHQAYCSFRSVIQQLAQILLAHRTLRVFRCEDSGEFSTSVIKISPCLPAQKHYRTWQPLEVAYKSNSPKVADYLLPQYEDDNMFLSSLAITVGDAAFTWNVAESFSESSEIRQRSQERKIGRSYVG